MSSFLNVKITHFLLKNFPNRMAISSIFNQKLNNFTSREILPDLIRGSLKEVAQPRLVTQGADFLGYITFPHHRLVRRRVVGNCREKLRFFEKQVLRGDCDTGYQINLNPPVIEALRAMLNSYWAHFQHANSFHLRQGLINRFKWLTLLFDESALLISKKTEKKSSVKKTAVSPKWIKPLWEPNASALSGYNSQIRFFRQQFPSAHLFIQRGIETDTFLPVRNFCNNDDKPQAISHQVRKVVIIQQGTLKGGLKRRCVQTLYIQPGVELCHF